MPEPTTFQHFTGPHPSCREFTTRLIEWGFTQRKQEKVDIIFHGPRGGTLRVSRSQLGRTDPALAAKAASLVGVTPDQFWAGPEGALISRREVLGLSIREPVTRDSVVSLVLAIHADADRPLGFDQVVKLSGNRVTRDQVRSASSALCRDGQLDRIRSGVYQWSAGCRATLNAASVRTAEEVLEPFLGSGRPVSEVPGRSRTGDLIGLS